MILPQVPCCGPLPSAPARGQCNPTALIAARRTCSTHRRAYWNPSHARLWSGALTVCCSTPRSTGARPVRMAGAFAAAVAAGRDAHLYGLHAGSGVCRAQQRLMSVAFRTHCADFDEHVIKPKRNGHRILNAGAGTTTPYHHALHGDMQTASIRDLVIAIRSCVDPCSKIAAPHEQNHRHKTSGRTTRTIDLTSGLAVSPRVQ